MITVTKETPVTAAKPLKKGPQAVVALAHGSSEMADLLSRNEGALQPKVGDLTSGKVLSISKNGVVLDIGGRLTGLVRGKEYWFRVRAVRGSKTGPWSDQATRVASI